MMPRGFSERLRLLRKQKKLSQTKLASEVGVHYIHVGRYEQGKASPGGETLLRLANALGVSVDFLAFGSARRAAEDEFEDREMLMLFREIQALTPYDKISVKKLIADFIVEKKKPSE